MTELHIPDRHTHRDIADQLEQLGCCIPGDSYRNQTIPADGLQNICESLAELAENIRDHANLNPAHHDHLNHLIDHMRYIENQLGRLDTTPAATPTKRNPLRSRSCSTSAKP